MKTNIHIHRKRETGNPGNALVLWLMTKFDQYRERKRAAKNHRELLKLSEHLRRDLGFDNEGRPLNPRPQAKLNMAGPRVEPSKGFAYQCARARSRPNTAPGMRLVCLR